MLLRDNGQCGIHLFYHFFPNPALNLYYLPTLFIPLPPSTFPPSDFQAVVASLLSILLFVVMSLVVLVACE